MICLRKDLPLAIHGVAGDHRPHLEAESARLGIAEIDRKLAEPGDADQKVRCLLIKASMHCCEGEAARDYKALQQARSLVRTDDIMMAEWLYTIIYFQGVTGLRRGETENCVLCRGESSCILPIAPGRRPHQPAGSRLAIKHFTEYLGSSPTTSKSAGCSTSPT